MALEFVKELFKKSLIHSIKIIRRNAKQVLENKDGPYKRFFSLLNLET